MRRVLFDLSLTTSVYNFLIVHFSDACFYYFCFDYFCKHVHCPRSDCMIMILCICKIKPILFYQVKCCVSENISGFLKFFKCLYTSNIIFNFDTNENIFCNIS
jgi:hypothetical protein